MGFIAAKLNSQGVPRVRTLAVAADVTSMTRGALMVQDSDGLWDECGADPAAVGGVSENEYGADTTGFVRTGRKEFPPGMMPGSLVSDEQVFRATYTGTLPAAPGGSYGVVKDGNGDWHVDFSETTATRVKLVSLSLTESPLSQDEVLVVFLPAVVQIVA